MGQEKSITFYAAGEVCVNRDNPVSIVELIVPAFARADIKFCQLETVISERGYPSPENINLRAHPRNISALKAAGFDVACFSSNHAMDWGKEGLLDTVELLGAQGIQVFGVGANVAEARKPAIVERGGMRMAFLGYNCNLPQEYWAATDRRPGCAALRVCSSYEPIRLHPGSVPAIQNFADRRDLEPMLESVTKARATADVVAVSMHWGLFSPPHYLVDYQIDVAHRLIDAGADMLLGTGPHQIKPIEVYKGKVIFYSLGNFAFDFGRKSGVDMETLIPDWKEHAARLDWDLEDEWLDNFNFPPRGRKAVVGKWTMVGGRIQKASFLPVIINKFSQPRLLSAGDAEFDEIASYVEQLCRDAKLDTELTREKDEVVIHI